ncbi:hypothetical protein [Aminivibrio sp.]|uniref:hypothetical protein n=1 Tax=Aminivibrio sp. TaxID=1872489 RepID=UPI003D991C10
MENILTGRAHIFGDNINTDYIIAGKYTKTLDFTTLAEHVFEDIAPGFSQRVRPGDIVAAGRNFGCGSSREQAPIAIKVRRDLGHPRKILFPDIFPQRR